MLEAQPVSLQTLPPELTRDWMLPDGRARVQVMPKPEARNTAGLAKFVDEVTAVAPDAGGSAVTIEATSATIVGSFRSAAISALIAITAILFVALRRPLDVSLVLAPLLLSSLMTVVVIVLLPLLLNYANIIALPLLLGVGVSFNIYFVMNWRAGQTSVLGSATARAILFSALTTGTAFGSLALSRHPGTASMGTLAADQPGLHPRREPRLHPGAAGGDASTRSPRGAAVASGCPQIAQRVELPDAMPALLDVAEEIVAAVSEGSPDGSGGEPVTDPDGFVTCSGRIPKRCMYRA